MEIITQSAEETQRLGYKIGSHLKGGEIITLSGELGAGKTTFVQGIAAGLGISSRIVSPTFIIMRDYPYIKDGQEFHLYHVDLYRLESNIEDEVFNLGIFDLWRKPNSIFVIEWAEKLKELPETVKHIQIKARGDTERSFIFNNFPDL